MSACFYLHGLSTLWIVMEIHHLISALVLYEFVVNSLGCNDATKNHSMLFQMLKRTPKDGYLEFLQYDEIHIDDPEPESITVKKYPRMNYL
jgi:hypothetical protein